MNSDTGVGFQIKFYVQISSIIENHNVFEES